MCPGASDYMSYKCPECQKIFRMKGPFKKHLEKKHWDTIDADVYLRNLESKPDGVDYFGFTRSLEGKTL